MNSEMSRRRRTLFFDRWKEKVANMENGFIGGVDCFVPTCVQSGLGETNAFSPASFLPSFHPGFYDSCFADEISFSWRWNVRYLLPTRNDFSAGQLKIDHCNGQAKEIQKESGQKSKAPRCKNQRDFFLLFSSLDL